MDIGLYANTHGLGYRDETNLFARSIPAAQMRPVQIAQLAERSGFHSLWFPDHVCMPRQSTSAHAANASGTRAYEPQHNMLDAAVVMGAVAVSTSRLKLATSVLIAPYRGPLNDARQFASVDQLSNGRLILGVGAGWMKEEFDALGLPYEKRGAMTNECIEIYKQCWTKEVVSFQGRFYRLENLSMDPKPMQKPRPPIVYGGIIPASARRAARYCDGFYPLFLDPHAEPTRFGPLQDVIRREMEQKGRDPANFSMLCAASARLTSRNDSQAQQKSRPICTGIAEQVLSDLERLAEAGYSLVVCLFDCPSGRIEELEEQIQRFAEEILPAAKGIKAKGGWQASV
jgi:probable F420-dependent oxidoreductase